MGFFIRCIFLVLFCGVVLIYFLIGNHIGDQGAEAIAEALKVNGVLQDLYLSSIVLWCCVDLLFNRKRNW